MSVDILGTSWMRRAQRTSFNTLDNWGHKTPTQSKRKRTGKKRLKDHSPKHIQCIRLHIYWDKTEHSKTTRRKMRCRIPNCFWFSCFVMLFWVFSVWKCFVVLFWVFSVWKCFVVLFWVFSVWKCCVVLGV